MPIIVKDYTWTQTEKVIFITVPLKGIVQQKVDILSTENYVKINFAPYIFECFLFGQIQDRLSTTEIGNGLAVLKLSKAESGMWPQLHNPDAESKEAQKALREAAILRYGQRANEEKKERDTVKHELGRYGVSQQMKLEQAERQRIEELKESERKQATAELEKWKESQRQLAEAATKVISEAAAETEQRNITNEKLDTCKRRSKKLNIFHELAKENSVRESGKISVSFTPRCFPTPTRESTDQQEQEWLKKVAESQRIRDLQNKDLKEEERNPVWLRDKGNSYIKSGDYKSAISAFTHAIQLDYQMASLYSNRALCYLAQLNDQVIDSTRLEYCTRCIDDCSKALELLTPPVAQNLDSRLKAHVRRGTAYCYLELYVEALQDYEAALKLNPTEKTLQDDADRIRKVIQGSSMGVI